MNKIIAGIIAIGAIAAAATLYAVTLPSSDPVHQGMSQAQILGYIADNSQKLATGSGVATLPASAPAHSGLSQGQLLGYIADNLQDVANARLPVYRPETYAAANGGSGIAGDLIDDRVGIQAAIDAAIAAGGGIVQLGVGRYIVNPVSGFAILTDGAVTFRGAGEGTEIQFKSSTAGPAYCGIAPKGYNTCTAPYTAAPLWIEDMRLTSDDYTSIAGHDLIGICHCPWAVIRRVGFEQIFYHAFEINVSKNVLVEDCYTYGTGNFGASIIELDGLGAAGQMASGGSHSASTPIENITIRRFVQRVARTDLAISTLYDFILLSHTNSSNVLRNVTIEGCSIIPHRNSAVLSGASTVSVVGFDTGALPLTVDGLYIRNNVFQVAGGLNGNTVLIDTSAASSATRSIRNVEVIGNVINSPHVYAIRTGAINSDNSPRTSITDALLRSHENVRISGNQITVNLNGNGTNGTRAIRSVWCGACRNLTIDRNTIVWPDAAFGAGWGTSTVNSPTYGFFIDHPQNLQLLNNIVEVQRPQTGGTAGHWCQVMAFVFSPAAFEIQSPLRGHWDVIGNTAIGNGAIGINLSVGFLGAYTSGTTGVPQWTTKTAPRITGRWGGNMATTGGTFTHTLQNTYPEYFVPGSGANNTFLDETTAAALGAHDWYPQAGDLGIVSTVPAGTTMAPGWKLYDGTASTALPWLQEIAWNQRLGLSGTANLPTTANTYIRLSGN